MIQMVFSILIVISVLFTIYYNC